MSRNYRQPTTDKSIRGGLEAARLEMAADELRRAGWAVQAPEGWDTEPDDDGDDEQRIDVREGVKDIRR